MDIPPALQELSKAAHLDDKIVQAQRRGKAEVADDGDRQL